MNSRAPGKTRATREVLQLAIRRLSPGDYFVGDVAAEITVLRHAAHQVPVADATTEILKAVAVLGGWVLTNASTATVRPETKRDG
jgi:hypothetical protein